MVPLVDVDTVTLVANIVVACVVGADVTVVSFVVAFVVAIVGLVVAFVISGVDAVVAADEAMSGASKCKK